MFKSSVRKVLFIGVLLLISSNLFSESTEFELFYPDLVPEGSLMTQSYRLQDSLWVIGTFVQVEKSPVVFVDQDGTFISDKVFYRAQVHFLGSYKFFNKFSVGFDFPGTFLSDQLSDDGKIIPHLSYLNDMVLSGRYSIWNNDRFGVGVSPFLFFSTGNANNLGGTDYRFAEPGIKILGEYFKDDFFTRINIGYSERDYTSISKYRLTLGDKLVYNIGVGGKWYKDIDMSVELNGSSQLISLSNMQTNALEILFGAQKRSSILVMNMGTLIFSGGLGLGITKAYGVPAWRLIFGVYAVNTVVKKIKPKPLPKPGILKLSVVNKKKNKLAGAKVLFVRGGKRIEKLTNKFGTVSFKSLAGTVKIKISKKGYYPLSLSQEIISGKTIEKIIVLKRKKPTIGKLVLYILNEEKKPVSGVTCLIEKDGKIVKRISDIKGKVSFIDKKGTVKISLHKEGYYDKDFEGTIKAGKLVRLKVLFRQIPKKPIVNVSVFDSKTGEPLKNAELFVPELKIKFLIDNGKLSKQFDPGNYTFVFSAKDYFPDKITAELKNNQVKNFSIKLIKKDKKQKVVVTEKEILIVDKIYFKTASSKILRKSYPILDSIVKVLKEHKEIKKLIIKGYTDSRGSRKYNLRLSQNRAKSVMKYFIRKGISRKRLEYRGYGPDDPIADNSTKEGRSQNRRVEFEIVK